MSKRFSDGMRKRIRRKKARIRRDAKSTEDAEEKIREFLSQIETIPGKKRP